MSNDQDHNASLAAVENAEPVASAAATARHTEPCPACGGYGLIKEINYVTRDMAIDAGDLRWEGEPMRSEHICPECGGAGEFEIENATQSVSEAGGSVPSAAQESSSSDRAITPSGGQA